MQLNTSVAIFSFLNRKRVLLVGRFLFDRLVAGFGVGSFLLLRRWSLPLLLLLILLLLRGNLEGGRAEVRDRTLVALRVSQVGGIKEEGDGSKSALK